MNKPDVIIGTCLYNRSDKWRNYLKRIDEVTKVNYHIYLMNHYDELCPEPPIDHCNCSISYWNEYTTVVDSYNLGLKGYNIPLEMGRILDVPVMLTNDDTLFGEGWDECLLKEDITEVVREGKKVTIDPKTIGCIGPCYANPGCMLHQKYHPANVGYTNVDYVVGHAQLITRNALRKGFTFDNNICTVYGAFDIYQSMWMCANDLNTLVCHDICFDFPESKESHFHNGDPTKFHEKLDPAWKEMQKNLEEYQKKHIERHGYNKWFT